MEVINSFIGLSFTVVVLSILLLPVWVAIEKGINSYLGWSTLGNVDIETPLKKIWNKLLLAEQDSFICLMVILVPIFTYTIWVVCIILEVFIAHEALIPTIMAVVIEPIMYLGAALAPILMVILPFIGFSLVLRKIFKFKEEIEDRLSK